MDKNVNYRDLRQAFLHTVCLVNKEPVYVLNVSADRIFQVKDLKTNKQRYEDFDPDKLKSPLNRLGMVNRNGVAYYLVRSTARIWQMGINQNNVHPKALKGINYGRAGLNMGSLSDVAISEVADTLAGIYPTFEEAIQSVKTFGGIVAFDRQFAICEDRLIYYKEQKVGRAGRSTKVEDISFDDGFKHLACVIGAIDNEKIKRSLGA